MKYIFNIFHYCSKVIGAKPLRLLMDQRSGKFLGALNQTKLMGSPKAGTSQGASPPGTGLTYTSPPQTFTSRGMVQHKPRMMRPRRMWPGERPPVPSSMTSNINQVRKRDESFITIGWLNLFSISIYYSVVPRLSGRLLSLTSQKINQSIANSLYSLSWWGLKKLLMIKN